MPPRWNLKEISKYSLAEFFFVPSLSFAYEVVQPCIPMQADIKIAHKKLVLKFKFYFYLSN